MKTNVLEHFDFKKVNTLLESFNKSTGFVTAILDLEGNILSQSGWREICTDFHRKNSETRSNCLYSDTILANKNREEEKYHYYKCANGLIDVGIPIVVDGEHIANLFSGQFFFEEPDISFFKKQAERYGFDEGSYLKVLGKVPVVSKEEVEVAMNFLLYITQILIEMTVEKMEQMELIETIKKSEMALLESQVQLKKNMIDLLESQRIAHLGTWTLDLETNQVVWSEELYKMYGFDPTLPPPPYTEHMKLFTQESWDKLSKSLEQTSTFGIPYELELETVTKDGENGWMWVLGEATKDSNGKITSIWGAAQDITLRKKTEEKLIIANEEKEIRASELLCSNNKLIMQSEEIKLLNDQLETRVASRTAQLVAANTELETLSYSISHDLKAPLRHISGYVSLLGDAYGEQLPDEGRRYFEIIIGAANKMSELIDGLLLFSRTGRIDITKSFVNMNDIINAIIQPIEEVDTEHRIKFNIDSLPSIFADLEMMKSVWGNLIENAVKFTRNKETALISIGAEETENEVVYFIKDNGAGFNMQYAKKLFSVFQRLHTQDEFEGTGIGLATVQRIINRHGGKIWAEAKVDEGSKFYYSIEKK